MQNAYYKLVTVPGGFGVHLFAPKDGGDKIVTQELINYLDNQQVTYDLSAMKVAAESGEDQIIKLGDGECPKANETYNFTLSPDNLIAVARFIPPSDTGERMSYEEFIKDMNFRQIRAGIQEERLKKHFSGPGYYGVQVPVAKGKKPRHGKDALRTPGRRRLEHAADLHRASAAFPGVLARSAGPALPFAGDGAAAAGGTLRLRAGGAALPGG